MSADVRAIVASNLVSTVALLRANRWAEADAKRYVLRLYEDFKADLSGSPASEP